MITGLVIVFSNHGGLTQFHVSGEASREGTQEAPDVQLTVATNREAILGALGIIVSQSKTQIPIILEGDPLPDSSFLPSSGRLRKNQTARLTRQAEDNMTQEIELLDESFPGKFRVYSK